MEPMDVLEKLLLLIATMTLGVLEIALEPLAADKEPTRCREADKDSSASNNDDKGGRSEAVGEVRTM